MIAGWRQTKNVDRPKQDTTRECIEDCGGQHKFAGYRKMPRAQWARGRYLHWGHLKSPQNAKYSKTP